MDQDAGKKWDEWIREREDPKLAPKKLEALDDLLVLDVSFNHLGGVVCSSLLSEFGAEVIRIEPPAGDPSRFVTPQGILHEGVGLAYLAEGRNKLHITLNLETADGREIFHTLAQKADVLIETYRPGTMDKWGVGYRQLSGVNPRLIYAALYTYGQFGPKASCGKPDYDVADQALSGMVWASGEMKSEGGGRDYEVPTKIGVSYGWYVGGYWTAFGILAALHYRGQSGRGQMVDVSGAEGVMRFMDCYLTMLNAVGYEKERAGGLDEMVNPYSIFKSRDGYCMVAAFSDDDFRALTVILGMPELAENPNYKNYASRMKLSVSRELYGILAKELEKYSSEEILQKVQEYMKNKKGKGTVITGPVNTPLQVLSEFNWRERGALQEVEDPGFGKLVMQGPVWKMTESPPRLKWACRQIGQDNAYVYRKYLGYGPRRLNLLKEEGTI